MLTAVLGALLAVQEAETAIPFERIAKRETSARGPACEKVIRDAKGWKAFWDHYAGGQIPMPPPPAVDFTKEAVVAVVDPVKPSSGYAVEITRIVRTREAVVVSLRRETPPPGKGQLAVMTEPACIVRAKLPPDLPVRFEEEKR